MKREKKVIEMNRDQLALEAKRVNVGLTAIKGQEDLLDPKVQEAIRAKMAIWDRKVLKETLAQLVQTESTEKTAETVTMETLENAVQEAKKVIRAFPVMTERMALLVLKEYKVYEDQLAQRETWVLTEKSGPRARADLREILERRESLAKTVQEAKMVVMEKMGPLQTYPLSMKE